MEDTYAWHFCLIKGWTSSVVTLRKITYTEYSNYFWRHGLRGRQHTFLLKCMWNRYCLASQWSKHVFCSGARWAAEEWESSKSTFLPLNLTRIKGKSLWLGMRKPHGINEIIMLTEFCVQKKLIYMYLIFKVHCVCNLHMHILLLAWDLCSRFPDPFQFIN